MNALEQELTDGFARIAQDAPHDLGLLSRVQARTTVRTRSRRYVVAFAAAAVVAVVGAAVAIAPGSHKSSLQYAKDPATYFSEHTTDLTFPFTPTVLTAGAKLPPVVTVRENDRLRLVWYPDNATNDDLDIGVSDRPMTEDPQRLSGGVTRHDVTVRGVPGVVACSDIFNCALTWHDAQGSYLRIVYLGTSVEQASGQLMAVANGLQVTPLVPHLQLRVGLIPRGCTVKTESQNGFELTGPAAQCHVSVFLPAGNFSGKPVVYGGRHGVESLGDDTSQRQEFLKDPHLSGQDINVLVPVTWQRNLIDAFVRSIEVQD